MSSQTEKRIDSSPPPKFQDIRTVVLMYNSVFVLNKSKWVVVKLSCRLKKDTRIVLPPPKQTEGGQEHPRSDEHMFIRPFSPAPLLGALLPRVVLGWWLQLVSIPYGNEVLHNHHPNFKSV